MTEFEMLTLWYQIIELANTSLTNFLTVLLGMLAVSYFASDKLDRAAAASLLILFSVFSLGMIHEIYSAYRDFAELAIEIHATAQQSNSSLSWLAMSKSNATPDFVPYVVLFMCGGAYIMTVAFFIINRKKKNRDGNNNAK